MATAKVRIKIGSLEIDYEGDSAFLDKDLLKLVQDIQKVSPAVAVAVAAAPVAGSFGAGGKPAVASGITLTTKSIATTFGAKSGSDLAEAAVAHLSLFKGMETFTRSDINHAMKSASGIYNSNMSTNLSKIIQTLLNQKVIVETSPNTYSLKPEAEAKFKGKLDLG